MRQASCSSPGYRVLSKLLGHQLHPPCLRLRSTLPLPSYVLHANEYETFMPPNLAVQAQ